MAFCTQDILLLEPAERPVSAAKCLGRQQATPRRLKVSETAKPEARPFPRTALRNAGEGWPP
jgi:hypothetical protein